MKLSISYVTYCIGFFYFCFKPICVWSQYVLLEPSPTVYAFKEGSVTVSCNTTYDWDFLTIKNSEVNYITFQYNGNECRLFGYQGRFSQEKCTKQNAVVTLRDLSSTDHNSNLICEIERGEQRKSNSSIIKIIVDLTISLQPNGTQTIIEDNVINFECKAKSIPQASITWYIAGSPYHNVVMSDSPAEDTVVQKLQFVGKRTDNNKIIYCMAENNFTTLNSTPTVLQIFYAPDATPNIDQTPPGPIFSKTQVNLTCTVSGGIPLAVLSWNCTGIITNGTSENKASYSVVFTVSKTDNNRICICSASHNDTKYKPTVQHKLTVFYAPDSNPIIQQTPPEPIISGRPVNLTCTVSGGNPLAILSWNCNGIITNETSGNKSSYSVIFTVSKTDNNRICICSASHNDAKYKPTVQHKLNVYYAPDNNLTIHQIPIGPIITHYKVKLTCSESGGNPLAKLSWDCTGTYTNSTSGNITFSSVELTVNKFDNYRICKCSATHPVTHYRPFASHTLVVYFPPDVSVSRKTDSLKEGDILIITCSAKGNPSNYSYFWVHSYVGTELRNITPNTQEPGQLQIGSLSYEDTGVYTCRVINGMEKYFDDMNNSASIFIGVEFAPVFLHATYKVTAKIDSNVSLTVDIFAYPDVYQQIQWFNQRDNFSLSNTSHMLITTETTSFNTSFYGIYVSINKYAYRSRIQLSHFSSNEEGIYDVIVSNPRGTTRQEIQLISSDVPSPPTEFTAIFVSSTTVLLSWISGSNGGNPQVFTITYARYGDKKSVSFNISESPTTTDQTANIPNLTPATYYYFYINASNIEGFADAVNNSILIRTLAESEKSSMIGPVGGAVGGVLFAVMAVLTILLVRRYKGHRKRQSDRKLFPLSSTKEEFSREGELKENILYISAGELDPSKASPSTVDVFVKKPDVTTHSLRCNVNETQLYSNVNKGQCSKKDCKPGGPQKDKRTKKQNQNIKDQELDLEVYENNDKEMKSKDTIRPQVNQDGLVYSELVFSKTEKKKGLFVIRGIENRTNYADIDLSLKADPLPSDDSETEEEKN